MIFLSIVIFCLFCVRSGLLSGLLSRFSLIIFVVVIFIIIFLVVCFDFNSFFLFFGFGILVVFNDGCEGVNLLVDVSNQTNDGGVRFLSAFFNIATELLDLALNNSAWCLAGTWGKPKDVATALEKLAEV